MQKSSVLLVRIFECGSEAAALTKAGAGVPALQGPWRDDTGCHGSDSMPWAWFVVHQDSHGTNPVPRPPTSRLPKHKPNVVATSLLHTQIYATLWEKVLTRMFRG